MFQKIIYGFFMCALFSCTGLVFQPSHQFYYSPEKTIQVTPESHMVPVAPKVALHAWFFHSKEKKPKGIVIQFHGNAENISSHFVSVAWVLNHGYDLVTFDYRGYGLSGGTPSFPEVITDGQKILEFVQEQYKDQDIPIIIYGQSLGSIIAANTVNRSDIPVGQVIFEGGIYSLNQVSADVLSRHWLTWFFQPFGYVLMSHKYNFNKIAKDFPRVPVLLLHSKNDPIIPYRQSQRIFDALSSTKCLKLVDEEEHINIGNVSNGKYRQDILDFLEKGQCKMPSN